MEREMKSSIQSLQLQSLIFDPRPFWAEPAVLVLSCCWLASGLTVAYLGYLQRQSFGFCSSWELFNHKMKQQSKPKTILNLCQSVKCAYGILLILLFLGAVFWAKEQDPFLRKWFTVQTSNHSSCKFVAVLPKPMRHY